MGVAATLAPKDLGPKNSTKKLAHVRVFLGHMSSQNHAPEISDPGPPAPLKRIPLLSRTCLAPLHAILRDPLFYKKCLAFLHATL